MKYKKNFGLWILICLLTILVGILLILEESSLPILQILLILGLVMIFTSILIFREQKILVPKPLYLETKPIQKVKSINTEDAFKSELDRLINDTKKSIILTDNVEKQLNHLKDKKKK
ncbi:MAG: hypothetical protein WC413_00820 [Candidatus Nanoarchaeia archaeon]